MSEKLIKPGFGQRVEYAGWLLRRRATTASAVSAKWERIGLREKRSGLFIGTRTLRNGRMEWINDEYGNAFFPEEYIEAWLIVPNANTNPIYALPEDVF